MSRDNRENSQRGEDHKRMLDTAAHAAHRSLCASDVRGAAVGRPAQIIQPRKPHGEAEQLQNSLTQRTQRLSVYLVLRFRTGVISLSPPVSVTVPEVSVVFLPLVSLSIMLVPSFK